VKQKTRKVLGWAILVYSGIFCLFFILTIGVPAIARLAHRTWIDYLTSLWLIYLSFDLGYSLVRGRLEGSTFIRLMSCVFLFLPLLTLQQASGMGQAVVAAVWIPWIRVVFLVLGAGLVIIPYLFGSQILNWLASRGSTRGISPTQGLCLIGLVFSVMPSMVGLSLCLPGLERQTIYCLVGISYVATAAWWAWWNHRYSRMS